MEKEQPDEYHNGNYFRRRIARVLSLGVLAADSSSDEAMDSKMAMPDEQMMSPRYEELDTDGDGYISEDELNVFGTTAA